MKTSATPLLIAIACAAAAGCAGHKTPLTTAAALAPSPVAAASVPATAIPRAVVYRMTGSATADNVPVTLNENGGLAGYPDPGDVAGQEPLELADGYLLDRRGICASSRFTRWTYAEYAALPSVPSPAEIMEAIIPDARVTDIHILPMNPWKAAADTAAVNRLIKNF